MQIAQRWILFRLRDRTFFSVEELNGELLRLTEMLNTHPFKKLQGCRRQRFEEGERASLKALPQRMFELCDWRYEVRVGGDHHVEHLRCFYSVPSHLAGERVDLRTTENMLEVFHCGRRVALHALLREPGASSTTPDHRPVAHQNAPLPGASRAHCATLMVRTYNSKRQRSSALCTRLAAPMPTFSSPSQKWRPICGSSGSTRRT